ncbi:AfsR/SARP family transcriptional regulator, partial [Mycobacterium pseudoshottsii]
AIDAEQWDTALAEAEAARALVRGNLLEDMADADWVREESARVTEMRVDCLAHKVTALLALGRVAAALTEAAALRALDPFADRGARLQMLALYRAGRAAEALDTYTRHARRLDDELGLEPGRELRDLQTAVLRQAPELAGWPRPPEWSGAATIPVPDPVIAEPAGAAAPRRSALVGRDRELARAGEVLAR